VPLKPGIIVSLLLLAGLLMGAGFTGRASAASATTTLYPETDVTTQWDANGCTDQWDCINDNPLHDGDLTYLNITQLGVGIKGGVWNLTDVNLNITVYPIVSVQSYAVYNSTDENLVVNCGGGSSGAILPVVSAWTYRTEDAPDCNGDAWTWGTINAATIESTCIGPNAYCNVTAMGVLVTYTVPAGSVDNTPLLLGFLIFILALILGIWIHPAFLIIAGIVGIYLAVETQATTGSWTLTGVMLALSALLIAGGGIASLEAGRASV